MTSFITLSTFIPTLNSLRRLITIYTKDQTDLWGHTVYRKPTHTNLCLNAKLHHNPANKPSVLANLSHRARATCDQDSLPGELEFLCSVFNLNSYSGSSTRLSIHLRRTNLERI
jgi:hypothetical protein